MVLVTASWRRRGIATRLVDACLNAATKLGLTTWLDATPDGATVYGPLGFTPTLQLRRLRLRSRKAPRRSGRYRPAPRRLDRPRCQRHGVRPQHIAVGIFGAPGSRIVSDDRGASPSSATDAPRVISARCWPIAPIRRSRWWMPSFAPRRGPWLIDAVHSQEEFLGRPRRIGLEHRAAVSAHALWPARPSRPRNCRSPSPARNLDRKYRHAS